VTIGQTKLYDNVFIKAYDVNAYDNFLKEHYAKIHKERVSQGMLLQWDVWKVVDTPQEDFTHMVTYIYDIEKYPNQAAPYEMLGMSNLQWGTIQKKVNQMRDALHKLNGLISVQQGRKGWTTLPEIMF
jgi:hypothetical protein